MFGSSLSIEVGRMADSWSAKRDAYRRSDFFLERDSGINVVPQRCSAGTIIHTVPESVFCFTGSQKKPECFEQSGFLESVQKELCGQLSVFVHSDQDDQDLPEQH